MSGRTDSAAQGRVRLTTHKVVIDANDNEHAAGLYERLRNDGYRVTWERHYFVTDEDGNMHIERSPGQWIGRLPPALVPRTRQTFTPPTP